MTACPSCNGELQTQKEKDLELCADCIERYGVNYDEGFSSITTSGGIVDDTKS